VTHDDLTRASPLAQVRSLLAQVASAPARRRVEKTLVLWELGYLREALSQFRVTAEHALGQALDLCDDHDTRAALRLDLERGRTSAVIERLHHELELIPARVGLQLYTLLAWGNYASHHQKQGHQARASDLAVLVSISLDLMDWLAQEVTGDGSIYEPGSGHTRAPAVDPAADGGRQEGLVRRITDLLLERAGPRLELEPHRLSVPDLSLELYWDMPPAPAAEQDEPYRGLRCFELEDAGRFFGRDALATELEDSVDRNRLTLLSGVSGAGKTSLLRAGALPRLLDLGCGVIILSDYSVEALELIQGLRERWGSRPLVLVLDQLERALVPEAGRQVLAQVLALMRDLGLQTHGRRVVAGIREEYLGRLLRELEAANGAAVEQAPVIVTAGPLADADCREAVTRPLQGSGVTMDPALLEQVLLPWLLARGGGAAPSRIQLVCSRLYEAARQREGAMDEALYRELGGAESILRHYLDRALSSGRYDGEQELARALLKGMTGPEVRRWADLGELWQGLHRATLVTDEVQLRSLLARLTDDRLVAARSGGPGAPLRYSLMHDQLALAVRSWRSPMELEQQEALERLERALASFDGDPRRRELLRGAGLALVERHFAWLQRVESWPRAVELLRASRRARRNRRLGLSALVGVALLGLLFGALQLRRAVQERDRSVQLADQGVMLHARQELERDPTLAVAWLRNLRQPTSGIAGLALAEQARKRGVARVITGHRDVVTDLAFSPDGAALASSGRDGTVRLHLLRGARSSRVVSRHAAAAQRVAFSPDGQLLASGGKDGVVRLHRQGGAGGGAGEDLGSPGGSVEALSFAPGGKTLAWAGEDPGVTRWSVRGHKVAARLLPAAGSRARILSLAHSPDGKLLAVGDAAGNLSLWDLTTGAELATPRHGAAVHALAFSPDGRTLASGDRAGLVRFMGPGRTPDQPAAHLSAGGAVLALAFTPDGRDLALAGADKEVRFVQSVGAPATDRSAPPLRGHLGAIHDLAISADGKLLATASRDNTIRIWDLEARRAPGKDVHVQLEGHRKEVWSAAFSPDGATLASAGTGGKVRLWDGRTGLAATPAMDHGGEAFTLAMSPSGRTLVSAGWGGQVSLLSLQEPRRTLATVKVQAGAVYAAAFSADGAVIALGGRDGHVHLLHGRTLEPVAGGAGMAHPEGLHALRFTRDGARLITGCRDGKVRLWDPVSRKMLGPALDGHGAAVYALALSPDGRHLASGSRDTTIRLWDLQARAPLGPALQGHHSWVLSLDYAPDGRTLASGSADGTIRFWDVAARRPLGPPLRGHADWVHTVRYAPAGGTLASGSADGTLWLWRLQPARLPQLLRRVDSLTNLQVSLDGRVSYRR